MSPSPEMVNDEEPQNENGTEAVVSEEEASFQIEPVTIKPRNNIYTLLVLISIIFIIVAIYLVGWELRNYYGATFGILDPVQKGTPLKVTEPSEKIPTDEGGQK